MNYVFELDVESILVFGGLIAVAFLIIFWVLPKMARDTRQAVYVNSLNPMTQSFMIVVVIMTGMFLYLTALRKPYTPPKVEAQEVSPTEPIEVLDRRELELRRNLERLDKENKEQIERLKEEDRLAREREDFLNDLIDKQVEENQEKDE